MDTLHLVVDVVVAALVLVGVVLVFVTSVAMFRAHDALGRVNVLGPATALGVPCLVVAHWLHGLTVEGFSWWGLARLVVTVGALLVVSSVASNTLARATYLSGSPVHPSTHPQDLARRPERGREAGRD